MKIVDARNKTCPQPVILTKKEADAGENQITTIVDNDISKTNVMKLSAKLNYDCVVEEKDDGIYLTLTKNVLDDSRETIILDLDNTKQNKAYIIGTDILGKGSDELGKILMKGFIYTISETKPYPNFMIFLNSGVKLTSEGSDSIDDLKKLEDAGVKITSCGTCLDFFGQKEKLLVGQVTNMYDIVETINKSDNTVMI